MFAGLPHIHKPNLIWRQRRHCRHSVICLLLMVNACFALPTAGHTSDKTHVVADIAPIHSLVSMVMSGIGEATLLIPATQSPHDFLLRPSHAHAMQRSTLLVMHGADVAPQLERFATTLNDKTVLLVLSEHSRQSQSTQTDNKKPEDHDHAGSDQHSWLNPDNAMTWIGNIADTLSALDPANASGYRKNAESAIQELAALQLQIDAGLATIRDVPFMVYHDAYRHFVVAFGLSNYNAVAISDARAPGAARIRQLRKQAVSVRCIFAEAQHSAALVNSIADGLAINRGILDPLGYDLQPGASLYGALLKNIASSLQSCLGR